MSYGQPYLFLPADGREVHSLVPGRFFATLRMTVVGCHPHLASSLRERNCNLLFPVQTYDLGQRGYSYLQL